MQATTGEGCFYTNIQATHMRRNRFSYTYSLVFAADMYATVFKPNPLDPARGAKYRDAILRPGGSREEEESLKVRPIVCPAVCINERAHRTSLAGHRTRRRSSVNCSDTQGPTFDPHRNGQSFISTYALHPIQ